MVHSRIDPEIKERAEAILDGLGMSPTEAIREFYMEITLCHGLPFEPEHEVREDDTRQEPDVSLGEGELACFDSVERMFERWNL